MQSALLLISTILAIIGPITYIVSILNGTSKPQRMTRFIIFFVLMLNFASILSAGGNLGAQVFATISLLQAAVIFFLSFWKGMGGTGKFDYLCLAIAVVGIAGWKITGNPVIGLWFSVLADFAGYLPAFVKTWKQPETESPWYYVLSAVSAILGLFAFKIESASVFQIYIFLSCVVMVGFICRKKFLPAGN